MVIILRPPPPFCLLLSSSRPRRPLGWRQLRNCLHSLGLLGSPAGRDRARAQTTPRAPSVLPSATLTPFLLAPEWSAVARTPSGDVALPGRCQLHIRRHFRWLLRSPAGRDHADAPKFRPLALWGLPTSQVSSHSQAPGKSSGVLSYAHSHGTSRSLGASQNANAATFVGSWEVQRSAVIRSPK